MTIQGKCFFRLRQYAKVCGVIMCLSVSARCHAQTADSLSVYVFLSETCPICQSTTIELKALYADYHEKGISFEGFFPSPNMSTEETRRKFEKKYKIPFVLAADKGQAMVKKYAATITPEVLVVRTKDNTILYRGKVDNSFESIGKRRQVVTEHYLKSALESILHNKPADPVKTEPVGCYISKS